MRLREIQVFARGSTGGHQKAVNQALFATYEPVRLWLREARFVAPFTKLVVVLIDRATGAASHGHVMVVDGICQVTEAVDVAELPRHALDHGWVLGIIRHALSSVAENPGWSSEQFEARLDELAASPVPLNYTFEKLRKRDKITKAVCVPWFRSRPG